MSGRKLLPYLAVLLVVAVGWLGSQVYQSRKESREKEAKKLFRVHEGDITQVILRKGSSEIVLQKNGQWRLTRPVEAKADPAVVASLLGTLARLDKQRALSVSPDELKGFGLDLPAFTVEFIASGVTHTLKVGAPTPGGRTYYALADADSQVQVINSYDKESLDRNLTNVRDKTIFTFSPEKVSTLAFRTPAGALTFQRTARGWTAKEQPATKIREDKVEAFLRQLTMMKVQEFIADQPADLKRFGLAPEAQITIAVTQDQDTQTLKVGGMAGERRYARKEGSPPVFAIAAPALAPLPLTLASWEDRRLWDGKEAKVAKIVWGPPEQATTAVKTPEGWKLTDPAGRTVEQPEMRGELALAKLKELEYSRLLPGTEQPAGAARFRVEMAAADGQGVVTLEEFPAPQPAMILVRVRRGGETLTAVVADKSWREWLRELEALAVPPQPAGAGQPPQSPPQKDL